MLKISAKEGLKNVLQPDLKEKSKRAKRGFKKPFPWKITLANKQTFVALKIDFKINQKEFPKPLK